MNTTIIFGVIAVFAKLLFGNQPYHQHYSECDIPICCYCNVPISFDYCALGTYSLAFRSEPLVEII